MRHIIICIVLPVLSLLFSACATKIDAMPVNSWSIENEILSLKKLLGSGAFYDSTPLILNTLQDLSERRPDLTRSPYDGAIVLVQYSPDNGINSIYFASKCGNVFCFRYAYSPEKGVQIRSNIEISPRTCSQDKKLSAIGARSSMPLINPGEISKFLICVNNLKVVRFAKTGGSEMTEAGFINGSPL